MAGVSKTIAAIGVATAFWVLYWWRKQCKQISNGCLEIFKKIITLLTVTVLFLFTFFNSDAPRTVYEKRIPLILYEERFPLTVYEECGMFSIRKKEVLPSYAPDPFGVFLSLTVIYLPAQLTAQLELSSTDGPGRLFPCRYNSPDRQFEFTLPASGRVGTASSPPSPEASSSVPVRHPRRASWADPALATWPYDVTISPTPATPVRCIPHMFTEYRERGRWVCANHQIAVLRPLMDGLDPVLFRLSHNDHDGRQVDKDRLRH